MIFLVKSSNDLPALMSECLFGIAALLILMRIAESTFFRRLLPARDSTEKKPELTVERRCLDPFSTSPFELVMSFLEPR